MRVASNTFSTNLMDQLMQLQNRQNRLQNQAATGQKLTLPEDDPGAMRRVLDLQTASRATAQYQSNISALQEQATTTYNAISSLKTISDRAGEIATLADGLKSPQELATYATEVTNLIKQAVQVVNTKDRGNYILAGTKTDTQPFIANTDANGNVTSVSYNGNTDVSQSEIAENVTVTAQVPGENSSGSGPRGLLADSRYGADFLNHLISLQNHLLAGDTASIASTDRAQLGKDEENILYHIGANGALQSRLDSTDKIASQQGLSIDGQISQETSADLAQTLTQLSQTQTAYQAALQSGAKLMGTSLLDYLK
jgi:flagellar hook-associated protein 3 FlgL